MPTISRFGMARNLPVNAMLVVFCPFAAGYFLSFFFRNVNAIISKDLAGEFALTPADLGFLTSMYLLAFAAFQLPLGVLLDRYGPRRVVAALLLCAAAGALVFGLARDLGTLSLGRALMGAIKAFSLWFPLSRLATLNGLYLAVGGLGSLAATAPAEAVVEWLGWRGMFFCLSAMSLAAAVLVFFVVPEKPLPGQGQTLRTQIAGFGRVFSTLAFWRIGLPLVFGQGIYIALQGLWLGPWLYDVAGQPRHAVAGYLLVTALGYIAGSVFFGVASDRLAQAGISRMTVYKLGLSVSLAMLALIAAGVQTGLAALLAAYSFTGISAALAYALLTPLFPPEMTGRVSTAANVLMFALSFAIQWAIGAALKLYPIVDGRYSPAGYTAALSVLVLLQLAAILWLLPLRAAQPRL
ncbi:MAG: MFS transporter [Betaproteobacteria bacterium]|nr:MAG: MFS transporter [Betaproteobacteria bacterium]